MTLTEVLQACAGGKLPRVESTKPISHTPSRKGSVTTIKNLRYRGIGVTFDGKDYEDWFYDADPTDGRKKYMCHLVLISE